MTVTGWNCDVCGEFVNDRFRTRHLDCPPPTLPESFYVARDRARAVAAAASGAGTDRGFGVLELAAPEKATDETL